MPASRPNYESDDELLSAYVDNELTSAERAAVEARLRTDERARQVVTELRAASEALQALPRAASPRDFAASVLGQIERERLAIEPPPVVTLPPVDEITEQGRRRGLIYVAAALAAAVMLMVLRPADQPPEPRQLAQGEPRRRLEAEPGAVQSKSEAAQLNEEKDAAAARPMATAPAPVPSPTSSQDADSSLARDRSSSTTPLEQQRMQSDLAATTAAAPATVPGAMPAAPAADAPLPAAPMSASGPASSDASGFGGLAEGSRLGGARRGAEAEVPAGRVEVYDVAATGDAAAAEFEQLLATHGIAIVDQPPARETTGAFFDALAGPREVAEADRQASAPVGAYLIEASPEQIAALAAALRADDGKFKLAEVKELSNISDAAVRLRATEGRGGFGGGGGRGGSEVQTNARAWRLSAPTVSSPATRDAEEQAATALAEQSAATTRYGNVQLATAGPQRALFVLQPEAATPTAPAAAAGEPQQ
jgi:hypothetical protein